MPVSVSWRSIAARSYRWAAEVDDAGEPAAAVVHVPLGEVAVDDGERQAVGADGGQRAACLAGCGFRPGAQPGARDRQPAQARLPVQAGVCGDGSVRGPAAGPLPEPRAEPAQGQVQAGQVTAPSSLLRGVLRPGRLPAHPALYQVVRT
jgi:hypothetical protein